RRVQEGELRSLPGDEGSRGRGDRPLSLVAAPGAERRSGRGAGAPAGGAARAAHPQRSGSGDRRRVGVRRVAVGRGNRGAGAGERDRPGSARWRPRCRPENGAARGTENRPQRSVPVRERKKVQKVSRSGGLRESSVASHESSVGPTGVGPFLYLWT